VKLPNPDPVIIKDDGEKLTQSFDMLKIDDWGSAGAGELCSNALTM